MYSYVTLNKEKNIAYGEFYLSCLRVLILFAVNDIVNSQNKIKHCKHFIYSFKSPQLHIKGQLELEINIWYKA